MRFFPASLYYFTKNNISSARECICIDSRVDIVEKISVIYDTLKLSYDKRNFTFDCADESLHLTTDEVKLLQIVNNFISNAIKFSRANESIAIKVTSGIAHVTISVKDGGIGIPDNLKSMIFETQFGAGRTGLNGEKSIGLGLSICKNLSQLLGGSIWFDSLEGSGSTFYLSLPKN